MFIDMSALGQIKLIICLAFTVNRSDTLVVTTLQFIKCLSLHDYLALDQIKLIICLAFTVNRSDTLVVTTLQFIKCLSTCRIRPNKIDNLFSIYCE